MPQHEQKLSPITSHKDKKVKLTLVKKAVKLLPILVFLLIISLLFTLPASPASGQDDVYGGQYGGFYNECERGPICDLGQQYYSPGDYVLDETIDFPASELKIIPHPYYEEYKGFTCKADECDPGYGETWYCASDLYEFEVEPPAIRNCPNFGVLLPYCNLSRCTVGLPGDGNYCEIGAQRECDDIYGGEWMQCQNIGGTGQWVVPQGPILEIPMGNCNATPPRSPAWMICIDGSWGVPGSGRWENMGLVDYHEQGRCEEMLTSVKASFTPGHVETITPHLFQIWQNTVNKTASIFTLFRTQLGEKIHDWPGQSVISYEFTNDYAEAGFPPTLHSGDDARIYFRYLGYIHCAKENLLNKLSSRLYRQPYVYYDARCHAELW